MRKVLFRCDGESIPGIETDCVMRCLLLADKLRGTKEFEAAFLMRDYREGVQQVSDRGYKVYKIPLEKGELEGTINAIRDFSPEIVVVDRLDTEKNYMKKIKGTGVILITLDDVGLGQSYADITINAMRESGISLYEGPEYIVLPEIKFREKKPGERGGVLLYFGRYDHLNCTLKTMKALENLNKEIDIAVVVSGAYAHRTELNNFLKKSKRNFKIYFQPKKIDELFNQADIAVISGGLTLFEAMARGIPSIVLCQDEHQVETARRYCKNRGATICLGMGDSVDKKTIYARVNELIKNKSLKESLRTKGVMLVDGKGLERVFNLIRIASILDWDTNFFGFKTATLHVLRLNEDIVKYALDYCKNRDVDVLYYLSNCHDPLSVKLAEKYGFHFTDIRLTFGKDLNEYVYQKIGNGVTIRECLLKDIPELKKIAEKSHVDSRYYFDQNYPRAICKKFYSEWIEKSCKGFADKVFVAEMREKAVGYITCDIENNRRIGRISLVGVDESAARMGIGSSLVYSALNWFYKEKIPKVIVITQGRNYDAQRLYQKCGFKTISVQLWYHKWFKNFGGD